MATYNWTYRPGIPNKYLLNIPDTPDDVKPPGITYFALFGNDETGNGSRMYPYRTPNTIDVYNIVASGVYRFGTAHGDNGNEIYGDGDVVFDISFTAFTSKLFNSNINSYNITFRGDGSSLINTGYNDVKVIDCTFDGCSYGRGSTHQLDNCIFKNVNTELVFNSRLNKRYNNCTFVNCANILLLVDQITQYNAFIFQRCNISWDAVEDQIYEPILNILYSLFYQCNFSKGTAGKNRPYLLYPEVSEDFTYIDNIEDFKIFISSGSGYNKGVVLADPKFNNPAIGDYSLAFDSPAKNASYFGTYIGALSIGYGIKARASEIDGDFDFSTNVNLNIEDNSITMANRTLLASIDSKVKMNLIARELSQAPIFGFYADRNGQYIDTIPDLSLTTINAASVLAANTPYIVEAAAIIYNGNVIQPGERFTTTSVTSFTTENNGVCREILEAPQRHTVQARFFDGGDIKTAGDPLILGYWYQVIGTITYNGNVYTDEVFKAVDTNPFTGTGEIREAMTNQGWQHYEPGIKFMSNNVGDVRTGEILRGNGDPFYQRGPGKEFPINARFFQFRYVLQPNNLKP